MNHSTNEIGIILVAIERLEKQHLPWIIDIKNQLDQGNPINDIDMDYLSNAIHDAQLILPYIDRHPEYEPLIAKVMHYYKIIIDEAVSNER